MAKRINGGITAPKGFEAAGIFSGIKKTKALDLALIVSEVPGPVAGVFTKNKVPAAPVILGRQQVKQGIGQAILVNSGNANAFTGREGLRHAKMTSGLLAKALGISPQMALIGSTGVIGVPLPMNAIARGIPTLISQLSRKGHLQAAQAIMTTDTRPKEIAFRESIGGKTVTIGGMAKGSGMIHPDMATMLGYLTTDAVIDKTVLQRTLSEVILQTFNCISVDGETSTNDTVLCLANGLAGNTRIKQGTSAHTRFKDLLYQVCHYLAMDIVRDGEGATKIIEFRILQAVSEKAAKQFANTLATSPLVKTAIFGADPNWGRIIAALGRSGPALDPEKIQIDFNDIPIVKGGKGLGPKIEQRIKQMMRQSTLTISISLGQGKAGSRIWTTDLTYDYVKINASYRS
ncbi:MAG: bifunctional glutamate N-acetyltransferase/amino-acid acetyltransferase ArgJ [Nitrospirales bacterium]|nr:bifunctional glutamate N-acetyltransferase/amino-acid acetyltransferase ArgJ [Nitrospirales bacterium]